MSNKIDESSDVNDVKQNNTPQTSPLLNSSVIVAIVSALFGTALGAAITGYYTLTLEQKKYEYSLIQKALDTADQGAAAKRLQFLLDADIIKNLNSKKIRDLASDPSNLPTKYNYPDYTIFICDAQSNNFSAKNLSKEVINSLSNMKRVGSIEEKIWNNYEEMPLVTLQDKLTIVFDPYEVNEVPLIKEQLKEIQNLPAINAVPNRGKESKWRLSLIVCPSK
jgi:hypothetical protein